MQVKRVLNEAYGIQEAYILDNRLCKYNSQIKGLSVLDSIDCHNYCLILASTDPRIYDELKDSVRKYFRDEDIGELSFIEDWKSKEKERQESWRKQESWDRKLQAGQITKIGKYSYGSLCMNHQNIESIGAFCSIASGCEVAGNHEMRYITTHPMIGGCNRWGIHYEDWVDCGGNLDWYFEGVIPKVDLPEEARRIKIGNEVWLGRNVIITNYSNIGNGVIAGAGSIITKDVPDYAIVYGVPAKIARYRYKPEEIKALNKIAWLDWEDEDIRERYEDFYLPVEKFIEKYL